ncbi:hypothetical protein AB0M20_36705 [Actinoplanes sp. NPDC051633]|uniref:hypothetical protein n=1 Tax=Actinoplanes sp. NPDC051633 TaxID=3155670 RepID=UPI00344AEF02
MYSDWGSHRLPVYEGTCHLLLNEPAEAVAILEAVIEKLGGNREKINVVLAATVDLASSYADLGELEQSCAILGDAYDQLQQIGNHRGIARARAARQRLARWDAEPVVRQLDSRMAAA